MTFRGGSPVPLTVVTDAPDYAASIARFDGPARPVGRGPAPAGGDEAVAMLADAFFDRPCVAASTGQLDAPWRFLVASNYSLGSQYDRLIELARRVQLPHGLACVARCGSGFKGFKGRSWVAEPGNIHVSVHFAPDRSIERFETVFMVLAALSVIDTIDTLPGLRGRAGIKWVNDILIDDAKVAGVLAYTQTRGSVVTSAVLGIGVNVEARPVVAPTAFVPEAASLRDFNLSSRPLDVLEVSRRLLSALGQNYQDLLRGGFRPLVDRYRDRSLVIGRDVQISADQPDEIPRIFAAGRVTGITDGLGLQVQGEERLIDRGRLILLASATATDADRRRPDELLDIAS